MTSNDDIMVMLQDGYPVNGTMTKQKQSNVTNAGLNGAYSFLVADEFRTRMAS